MTLWASALFALSQAPPGAVALSLEVLPMRLVSFVKTQPVAVFAAVVGVLVFVLGLVTGTPIPVILAEVATIAAGAAKVWQTVAPMARVVVHESDLDPGAPVE